MQLGHFDLNLLRALDALLTERNVTRAAERLFVTQQAMSGALRRLREFLDDALLVRVGRHFELTPLAQSLIAPVRDALLKVEAALMTKPGFDPATARRSIRMAMSDYASLVLLPRLVALLMREAPQVSVRVEPINDTSFRRLDHGDLDFCITVAEWGLNNDSGPGADTCTELLFEDDFVCVVDRRHHPAETMTLDAYRAARHNVVLFGRGIETLVERGWKAAGFAPEIAATAPSFSTLVFMVPGTPLVATAQRRLVQTLVRSSPLRILECPMPIDALHEHMIWHARNESDPAHVYFRSTFRKAAQKLDLNHK